MRQVKQNDYQTAILFLVAAIRLFRNLPNIPDDKMSCGDKLAFLNAQDWARRLLDDAVHMRPQTP